jgi:hypothetical protein
MLLGDMTHRPNRIRCLMAMHSMFDQVSVALHSFNLSRVLSTRPLKMLGA